MSESMVAEGINYLKLMRSANLNVYELAEDLEKDVEHIKRCIKTARERKEQARVPFETHLVVPRYYIGKGTKGEYQTLKSVELEFQKSITINYDTKGESEFFAMLPVKIRVKRHQGTPLVWARDAR